jgi:hypothetical protein
VIFLGKNHQKPSKTINSNDQKPWFLFVFFPGVLVSIPPNRVPKNHHPKNPSAPRYREQPLRHAEEDVGIQHGQRGQV